VSEPRDVTFQPKLLWDIGTAYDFFVSLKVLHEPTSFGVRAAWAAGMRSRLPAEARETLEQLHRLKFAILPFHWVHKLPAPKDSQAVLKALADLAPEDRLPEFGKDPEMPFEVAAVLSEVEANEAWDDEQVGDILGAFKDKPEDECPNRESVELMLEWWSRRGEFGERLLSALRAYHEVFFAEEENRIRPALQRALEQAQQRASQVSVLDLLEELSQGVRLDEGFETPELVLAPSYWGTPLIIYGKVAKDQTIILFGARPAEASLVPGEVVPDALLRTLKALSDPTRLRILRYISEEPLTPSQLSNRLRLRSSTVVHHLDLLRLATLVQFSIVGHGVERRYSARPEVITAIFANLEAFLGQGESIEPQPIPAEAETAA
jgi:DNA-binding transcriptional ArsR family regulator